jgi:manganese oxidase
MAGRQPALKPILSSVSILLAMLGICAPAGAQDNDAQDNAGAQGGVSKQKCNRTINASVVALDQVIMVNRLGTVRPGGMIFALRGDVVPVPGTSGLAAGNVQLRAGKRPRPIVLRMNVGDCLKIDFQNFLDPGQRDPVQPVTRTASIHVAGMQLVNSIADDGTYLGDNPKTPDGNESGLVAPGGSATYNLYAEAEGSFLLYSTSADFNGFGTDQLTMGLFGAVNVEPKNAEWYRSQVTNRDLKLAAKKRPDGKPMLTPDGQPIINYDACYPDGLSCSESAPDAKPILKMYDRNNRIVHTDLTAIITGPNAGRFGDKDKGPEYLKNPAYPDRLQPYREVTVHYHESQDVVQAFPWYYNSNNSKTPSLNAGADSFAINYGIAGIGSEILANRFSLGPTRDCAECKFEEFFLSSWAGGDPGMVVDTPANAPCTQYSPQTNQPSSQASQLEPLLVAQNNGQTVPPAPCSPVPSLRATMAFFPDDPSNVYHSYLGDHVKFQILHAGAAVHHVHHHHAHQWLHSPASDDGHYLDSQAIGPGSSFTLDLVYAGSGNRNLTPGDSIFHCHFYPHFASGMWALYRTHDVFEEGTELNSSGRPAAGSRALPDGEITVGTPIPAVVPLPTLAMAPMPARVQINNGQVQVLGDGNPGYPFFVPGIAGHRPPHPPLDFACDTDDKGACKRSPKTGETIYLDGGLPRHIILGATVTNEQHTPTDFSKDLGSISAAQLPEQGTAVEKSAMAYFGQRLHPSYTPEGLKVLWNGRPANFITNGLPLGPQPGAPFADPAVNDDGTPVCKSRDETCFKIYKGVNLQLNTVFNKSGWHYPQQRMMALWGDVKSLVNGEKPPEPLFFRANSGQVVEYWHTNLVPAYYELDDFQVRTPTDIMGQHIHLVKFDVLASDGAANGFNYEDGSFSPDEVRSRISGINLAGGLWTPDKKNQSLLAPKSIPYFERNAPSPFNKYWVGAQATVQRWWVDPLLNNQNYDRTITTVFTHDHFGPSTHQMAGLYGGLLVEPADAKWLSLDGKTVFGSRKDDGGPTSYAANIITGKEGAESYREFALSWQDLQLAYAPTSKSKADCYPGQTPADTDCAPTASDASYQGWSDPANVINCPACTTGSATGSASSFLLGGFGAAPSPATPLLISDFGAGMFSMNYRTEPLPLRVAPPILPNLLNPKPDKFAADLSHAFRSIERLDLTYSKQPVGGSPLDGQCMRPDCFRFPLAPISQGMLPADPFTPLLRAYANDRVQIRVLAGAHTSMHDFQMHGIKWRFEPHNLNSGFRASQFVILSEHFEMLFNVPPADPRQPSSSYEGLVNGTWGLLRAYNAAQAVKDLQPLPNNSTLGTGAATKIQVPADINSDCARGVPCLREFKVSAMTISQALGKDAKLVYNSRGTYTSQDASGNNLFDSAHPLYDQNAIIYVRDEDIDAATGRLKKGLNVEPLVLRAGAGDWIKVTLTNRLNPEDPVFQISESAAKATGSVPYSNPYAAVKLSASTSIGLHAQLVSYDITEGDGANVGLNPVQTVAPGDGESPPSKQYLWFAGNLWLNADGTMKTTPVEFGAINLMPSDRLVQPYRGLFGALVIEPLGSTWIEDTDYRSSATVFRKDGSVFRDFVLIAQNDIGISLNNKSLYQSGNPLSAFNYKSEPFFYRFGARMDPGFASPPSDWSDLSAADLSSINNFAWTSIDTSQAVSNTLTSGDPQTPIFKAPAGMPIVFRLLHAGGIGDNQQVFELTGHVWQEEPFTKESAEIGFNKRSQSTGTTPGWGPTSHFNVVTRAGGKFKVAGDYMYRSWTANQFQVGMWGVFRVAPASVNEGPPNNYPDTVTVSSVRALGTSFTVEGVNTVYPLTRAFANSVEIHYGGRLRGKATVDNAGRWSYQAEGAIPDLITARTEYGGVTTYRSYRNALPEAKAALSPKKITDSQKRRRHSTRQ